MAFRIAATQIAKRAALAAPKVRNNISGGWLGMEREREGLSLLNGWLAAAIERAGRTKWPSCCCWEALPPNDRLECIAHNNNEIRRSGGVAGGVG
jgi:hypothetical protein